RMTGFLSAVLFAVLVIGCANIPVKQEESEGIPGPTYLVASMPIEDVWSRLIDSQLYDDVFSPVYERKTLFPGTLFRAVGVGDPRFPSTEDLFRCERRSPDILRYASIDIMLKQNDIALRNNIYYWHSGYAVDGKEVPFRCEFVIHMSKVSPAATRIEVVQFDSIVLAGEKFMVQDSHGIPGYVPDYQCVEPSSHSTNKMLSLLKSTLGADMQGLP
ncbi:MAG: hypothetical protein KC519_21880, partial [Anaerolineae bacterium]|nr:hypothetical protein [Anaerolineae bacterium]